jgi:hypothetical protein
VIAAASVKFLSAARLQKHARCWAAQ